MDGVKENHIKQILFITSRFEKGRSNLGNATEAFCRHFFYNFNTTRMCLHLTSEEEGQTWDMVCKHIYSQKKSESMLFKTTFKWSLRLAIPLLSKKNGCKIKPISKFVNF